MKISIVSVLTLFCALFLIGVSGSAALGQDVNLALKSNNAKVTAAQSSANTWDFRIAGPPIKAIDGMLTGGLGNQEIIETNNENAWFEVDLGGYFNINKIVIHPRSDNCCTADFRPILIVTDHPINPPRTEAEKAKATNEIKVTDPPFGVAMTDDDKIQVFSNFYKYFDSAITAPVTVTLPADKNVGRYVRLQMKGANKIELAEIEIFGSSAAKANYTPDARKAWNASFIAPFDPNYPNYRGETEGGYFDTLQSSPKIVGVENTDGKSFDIAFQDNFGKSTSIIINTYRPSSSGFIKENATNFAGLGVFAGFAKDSIGNRYVFTGEPWSARPAGTAADKPYERKVQAQVFKISGQNKPELLWNAQYFNDFGDNKITVGIPALMNGFKEGTSRLVIGKGSDNKESLLITTNIQPTHPYQVILSTDGLAANSGRAFFESMYQHNFGQRAIFDGKEFVVMENRDHDVSVTLSKLKPNEVLPLVNPNFVFDKNAGTTEQQQKNEGHPNEYIKRVFSVYSHTNSNNYTYTELGNVEKGFNDDAGYLVLFASERDWDNKMKGGDEKREMPNSRRAPEILSPRDLGLIHVKKEFNTGDVNFLGKLVVKTYIEDGKPVPYREVVRMETNPEGNYIAPVQCPQTVDNSKLVNSTGATTTVAYDTADDGWYWPSYAKNSKCENMGVRTLVNKGVQWVTEYGKSYQASKQVATANDSTKPGEDAKNEFTSVAHPKLVRLTQNKYIALWEEYKADRVKFPNGIFGRPLKKYVTTKAVLITLSAAPNSEVVITAGKVEDLNLKKKAGEADIRLMPGDDAFELDGKAAWAVGNIKKGKLMFYTLDASLNLVSYELEY